MSGGTPPETPGICYYPAPRRLRHPLPRPPGNGYQAPWCLGQPLPRPRQWLPSKPGVLWSPTAIAVAVGSGPRMSAATALPPSAISPVAPESSEEDGEGVHLQLHRGPAPEVGQTGHLRSRRRRSRSPLGSQAGHKKGLPIHTRKCGDWTGVWRRRVWNGRTLAHCGSITLMRRTVSPSW